MSVCNSSFQLSWYLKKKAALKYFTKLKEKKIVPVSLFKQGSGTYSEPCQTSKMERFSKILDGEQPQNAES